MTRKISQQPDAKRHPSNMGLLSRVFALVLALLMPSVLFATMPSRAALKVTSQPPGATVYIDGINEGVTPFSERLAPKVYRIELRKQGYASWKDTFRLRLKGRAFRITLQKMVPKTNRQAAVHCPLESPKHCGYWRGCMRRDGKGCNNLGNVYFYGDGIQKNTFEARRYYLAACQYHDGLGCHNAATLYRLGRGGAKSSQQASIYYKKALAIYKRGCDKQNAVSCTNIGRLYTGGLGVSKNDITAHKYYQQACHLQHGSGCQALGMQYRKGIGARQNAVTANKYFFKACQLRVAKGCLALAQFHHNQLGGIRICWKANKYYQKACRLGHPGACNLECR